MTRQSDEPAAVDSTALDRLLSEGLENERFTGAAVAIGSSQSINRIAAVGSVTPETGRSVTEHTLFDLASLTKPLATAPVVLRLVEAGRLALSEPIGEYLDAVAGTPRSTIPVWKYLAHATGLDPYFYDPDWPDPQTARQAIYDADCHDPAVEDQFQYSCLNYVHLVGALGQLTGDSFSSLVEQYVLAPAGAETARLGPITAADSDDRIDGVAATYDHDRTDAQLVGECHDPIARALGGESGNAGLFGTIVDVASLARSLLNDGTGAAGQLLAPSTIERMWEDWLPEGQRAHGLGWRLAARSHPAANWLLSAVGHTGYTGTSVWLDSEADRFAVLLTNAVYYDPEGDFLAFRERFHGIVAGGRY